MAFRTSNVTLGTFRLAVDHPSFHNVGPIRHHVVAFPRTSVWIEHEHERAFVADASLATVYNQGQAYQRQPISPRGDETDWIGLSESIAREIVAGLDSRAAMADRPFRHTTAPVSPALYLEQWQLFEDVTRGVACHLEVEERAIAIATRTIAAAYASDHRVPVSGAESRELSEDAKAAMMSSLFENESVTELAARLGVSPFHLCRRFRRETGQTLHEYRRDLRLRASLGLSSRSRGRLTSLALDLGFHSHSHFSANFRRAFGIPPSRLSRA